MHATQAASNSRVSGLAIDEPRLVLIGIDGKDKGTVRPANDMLREPVFGDQFRPGIEPDSFGGIIVAQMDEQKMTGAAFTLNLGDGAAALPSDVKPLSGFY